MGRCRGGSSSWLAAVGWPEAVGSSRSTLIVLGAFCNCCRVYKPPKRAPLDNEYILGITLQHKQHLVLAAVTVLLCTASNLAAPVLSGMLFEHLVQAKPVQEYAQVREEEEMQLLYSRSPACRRRRQHTQDFLAFSANQHHSTCSWHLCPCDSLFGRPCPAPCPTLPSSPTPPRPDLLHPAGWIPAGAAVDACVHGQRHCSSTYLALLCHLCSISCIVFVVMICGGW